jgi:thermosome
MVLSEDSERVQGRDAQAANIAAGKAIGETVRTTLGPKGMDKMLVSDGGDVVITNDGVTILDEMEIEHPAADMLVEVADTQEEEVGDGTTTAAVLAGELLSEAESLLDDEVHPTTIVEGYNRARKLAREAVADQVLDADVDEDTLRRVAESSMTGKGTGGVTADRLGEAVVDAVRHVELDGEVDRDAVHVWTQAGRGSTATELVEGVLTDAEPLGQNPPRSLADASVAVVDADLEQRETEIDAEYNIGSADQLSAAVEAEEATLREYAEALVDAGVDVAFVTGDVADAAATHLHRAGVLVYDSVSSDDARAIARATGASQVATVEDAESDDLGVAESVRVETYDEDDVTFVEGGADAESVTLFVRGGTDHVIDELERAVSDGIDVVVAALSGDGVVPGAACTEGRVADYVRDEAASVEGRQQLAVEAFADALDVIPRTLAENAGMDPIDALVDLRAGNDSGRAGIIAEGETGEVADPVEAGVLDPAAVKREAIESATEAATMIARIDDVISAE